MVRYWLVFLALNGLHTFEPAAEAEVSLLYFLSPLHVVLLLVLLVLTRVYGGRTNKNSGCPW